MIKKSGDETSRVLACFIVYHNSLSNEFVYDDFATIVENKHLRNPGSFIAALFNHSYFKIASLEASYRPVATLSYFFIYSVAQLDPFYYHLASLLLHMLNAILVYWLANLILQNRLGALIAGLLFACHPVLTEAVNAVSYNEDLFAAFFFLLSFIFYINLNSKKYILSLCFYLLGLLSKEMAITLPAVIFLYDLTFRDENNLKLSLVNIWHTIKLRKFYLLISFFLFCYFFFYLKKI